MLKIEHYGEHGFRIVMRTSKAQILSGVTLVTCDRITDSNNLLFWHPDQENNWFIQYECSGEIVILDGQMGRKEVKRTVFEVISDQLLNAQLSIKEFHLD